MRGGGGMTKEDINELRDVIREIVQEETRKIVQEETRAIVQEETRKIVREEIRETEDRLSQRMDRLEGRMDRLEGRMDSMEARMDSMDSRLEEVRDMAARANILIEGELRPHIELLMEGHQAIMEKLDRRPTMEAFEDLEGDVDVIKAVVKYHTMEIKKLKKAQ